MSEDDDNVVQFSFKLTVSGMEIDAVTTATDLILDLLDEMVEDGLTETDMIAALSMTLQAILDTKQPSTIH